MSRERPTVRIFISSTFRDMHAERDHLVTVVFPELRERIERLGLEFFDVDLRWGVPETGIDGERANSWAYCKRWIDRCKPFFVCMLGQRYGYCPSDDEIPDEDRKRFTGMSITEMEIRHAAFSEEHAERSFFYFRDTKLPEDAPVEVREPFVDEPEQERLKALKCEIKGRSGRPIREYECEWTGEGFADLDALGEMVLEDLWSAVLRDERYVPKDAWRRALGHDPDRHSLYTDESQPVPRQVWEKVVEAAKPEPPDPLDQEAEEMARFAETRLRWFRGREEELRKLREFVKGKPESRLCVVKGTPGQGKSALLARLREEIRETGHIVIAHFVGATERSADVRSMLERLVGELDRNRVAVPEQDDERDLEGLRRRFAERLRNYKGRRRVVLLIDAVNQLTGGHELAWLPRELGPSVRLLVSCVDGPGAKEDSPEAKVIAVLQARDPVRVDVEPLDEEDVRGIVIEYLHEYCRELDPEPLVALCKMEQTRNPLYLLVALDVLRQLGGEGINLQIGGIIKRLPKEHPDATSLFDWLLERLEVFGRDEVRHWFAYLALGRVGMASQELSDLLARKFAQDAAKTALRSERGIRKYLLRRGAQLDFFHGQLRQAVECRCITRDRKSYHREIAEYLEGRWREGDAHSLGELPHHYHEASATDALIDVLATRDYLDLVQAVLSTETALDNLILGFGAARTSHSLAYAGRLLAAWGHAIGKMMDEDRVAELGRHGRIQDAVRAARAARPATRACRLMAIGAHRALDAEGWEEAEQWLLALRASRLPVARADLRNYLRLVERFVAAGKLEALDCLAVGPARDAAQQVICYLIGTRHLAEDTFGGLLDAAKRVADPMWRGFSLLTLCLRGLRHGIPQVERAGLALKEEAANIRRAGRHTTLLEAIARGYRWLAHVGIQPTDFGLTAREAAQCIAPPPPGTARVFAGSPSRPGIEREPLLATRSVGGQQMLILGADPGWLRMLDQARHQDDIAAAQRRRGPRHSAEVSMGTFEFVTPGAGQHEPDRGADALWAVARTVGRLVDTPQPGANCSGACVQHARDLLRMLLARDVDRPLETLFVWSLLPRDDERTSEIPDAVDEMLGGMFELGEDARMVLAASLARRGHATLIGEALNEEMRKRGAGARLGEVCEVIRELRSCPAAQEWVSSASEALKAERGRSRLGSIGDPLVRAATRLVEALVALGRSDEARYWMSYVIGQLDPSGNAVWLGREARHAVRTHALLSGVLSDVRRPKPLSPDGPAPEASAREAIARSPALDQAVREEYSTPTAPLEYLGSRIVAWMAEDMAWTTATAAEALHTFAEHIRPEAVYDDYERKRSWFLWLLTFSRDPSPQDLAPFRGQVEDHIGPRLPHELLVAEAVGIDVPDIPDNRDLAHASAALLRHFRQDADFAMVGRLANAAIARFAEPAEQAEVMTFAAQAAARQGHVQEAQVYAVTAEAISPGSEAVARSRVKLVQAAQNPDVGALADWPDRSIFAEALSEMLAVRAAKGDGRGIVELTQFMPESTGIWRELLLAIGRLPMPAEEAANLAAALLRDVGPRITAPAMEGDPDAL